MQSIMIESMLDYVMSFKVKEQSNSVLKAGYLTLAEKTFTQGKQLFLILDLLDVFVKTNKLNHVALLGPIHLQLHHLFPVLQLQLTHTQAVPNQLLHIYVLRSR
jgi:hypothetical protein